MDGGMLMDDGTENSPFLMHVGRGRRLDRGRCAPRIVAGGWNHGRHVIKFQARRWAVMRSWR